MNQYDAYPSMPSYTERAAQRFRRGSVVEVGPAYIGNNRYAHDGFSGRYYVVKTCQSGDCGLSRHHNGALEVWMHPSRMMRILGETK